MPSWFSFLWVPKLLLSPVKIRILCPKTSKFARNRQFWSLGPSLAGSFGALLMGWLGVVARRLYLARHLFTLYQQPHNTFAVKRSLSKFQNKLISIFPLVTAKKIVPLWHLFCPIYLSDGPFLRLISISHTNALRERKELPENTKKEKKTRLQSFP